MKKQSVNLRKRGLPSGKVSLYLDIYHHGVRDYEYLRLYLLPGDSRAVREKNRETMSQPTARSGMATDIV